MSLSGKTLTGSLKAGQNKKKFERSRFCKERVDAKRHD